MHSQGNTFPTKYHMSLKAHWSDDSEEEKDAQGQNRDEDKLSDIKDWDGDLENN